MKQSDQVERQEHKLFRSFFSIGVPDLPTLWESVPVIVANRSDKEPTTLNGLLPISNDLSVASLALLSAGSIASKARA